MSNKELRQQGYKILSELKSKTDELYSVLDAIDNCDSEIGDESYIQIPNPFSWNDYFASNLKWYAGEEYLTNIGDAFVSTHSATDRGSTRSQATIEIPFAGDTIAIEFKAMFEKGFSFGTSSKKGWQAGKFGFGVAGGHAENKQIVSGGIIDGGGFSVRFMWRDGYVKCYTYNKNRSGKWGDDYPKEGGYKIIPGEWMTIKLIVDLNTLNEFDGNLYASVNDQVIVNANGFEWMDDRRSPMNINTLFFSSFHGGSSREWSPAHTSYIHYKDFRYL